MSLVVGCSRPFGPVCKACVEGGPADGFQKAAVDGYPRSSDLYVGWYGQLPGLATGMPPRDSSFCISEGQYGLCSQITDIHPCYSVDCAKGPNFYCIVEGGNAAQFFVEGFKGPMQTNFLFDC